MAHCSVLFALQYTIFRCKHIVLNDRKYAFTSGDCLFGLFTVFSLVAELRFSQNPELILFI